MIDGRQGAHLPDGVGVDDVVEVEIQPELQASRPERFGHAKIDRVQRVEPMTAEPFQIDRLVAADREAMADLPGDRRPALRQEIGGNRDVVVREDIHAGQLELMGRSAKAGPVLVDVVSELIGPLALINRFGDVWTLTSSIRFLERV